MRRRGSPRSDETGLSEPPDGVPPAGRREGLATMVGGSRPSVARWRSVALLAAGVVVAACGTGLAKTTPAQDAPAHTAASPTAHGPTFGAFGCLSPRDPAATPAGGWLPASLQPTDWDPVGPGSARKSSAEARALGARFAHDLGASRFGLGIYVYGERHCVTGWDAVVNYSDGGYADERIMQLRKPLARDSFAFVGPSSSSSEGGVDIYQYVTPDRATMTEVAVRPDGLLVYVQIRSRTGLNMSGYPTTTTAPPSTGPEEPLPAPPATVTATALDLLQAAAAAT